MDITCVISARDAEIVYTLLFSVSFSTKLLSTKALISPDFTFSVLQVFFLFFKNRHLNCDG